MTATAFGFCLLLGTRVAYAHFAVGRFVWVVLLNLAQGRIRLLTREKNEQPPFI
jgi:hypothetical protein